MLAWNGSHQFLKRKGKVLLATVSSQRNWKRMGISIFVILSVMGLVALSVIIITPPEPGPRLSGRILELSDIMALNYNFSNKKARDLT